MASRPDPDEDETLELTEDMIAPEDEETEGEDEVEAEDPDAVEAEDPDAEEGDEETLIGFAEDEAEATEGDSSVIRRLRERNKELARENAEYRRSAPEAQPDETLEAKPTFSDCGYDEEKFEAALTAWQEKRAKIEANKSERRKQAEAIEREWQRDLEGYEQKRIALGRPDFDEVADTVKNHLNLMQQAVVIKAAGDAATFFYALGQSDARLAELAKIQDPVKLAAAVARMEGGIKVVKKRKAPAPDRPASGSARLPGGPDKQLEKLETDAERTGDRTALIKYKSSLKARGKK